MPLLRLSTFRQRAFLPPRPSLGTLRAKIDCGELPGGRKLTFGYFVDPELFHAADAPRPSVLPLPDVTDPMVRRAVGL